MKNQLHELNEDQLMRYLAAGNIEALEELYKLHATNIYKYAVRILGSPVEADDMVQEVFLRIWKNRDKYDPASHFRAWALRICANMCIDRKRKADCRNVEITQASQILSNEMSPEMAAINKEGFEKVLMAFQLLAFADQQILALRFDGDLSVSETAEILDCSIRTVHYRTAEAIKHLQIASGVIDEQA